jgi:hypothetical protein
MRKLQKQQQLRNYGQSHLQKIFGPGSNLQFFLHLMQITVWRFLALMSTKERHLWAGFFTLKSVNAKFV